MAPGLKGAPRTTEGGFIRPQKHYVRLAQELYNGVAKEVWGLPLASGEGRAMGFIRPPIGNFTVASAPSNNKTAVLHLTSVAITLSIVIMSLVAGILNCDATLTFTSEREDL